MAQALNSINTNIGAYYAQMNINRASNAASNSVARLSSGNRIVQAKDDVSSMAAGTSLRTNVTTLRMALINTAQGASLLQVADGALAQIGDILQRQKALAIQAGAGSMSDTERGFLNQEFENLRDEIDRLTANTNFNGVVLLDGSVFEKNTVGSKDNIAAKASGAITLIANPGNTKVIINNVTFSSTTAATGANQYLVGATLSETLDNLANALNGSTDTRVSIATYKHEGNSLIIESKNGGVIGQTFTFDLGTLPAGTTGAGIQLGAATRFSLQGADDAGISFGRTVGRGVIGDSLVTGQNQVRANQTINMPVIAAANLIATLNTKTITFNTGAANLTFTYTTAPAAVTDIQIGATLEETMDNAVRMLNNYKNTTVATDLQRFPLQQIDFTRDGRSVVIERRAEGNVNGDNNTAFTVVTNVAGATPAAAVNFNNGATGGVSTAGVANKDFVGSVDGFEAVFTGVTNRVDLEITIGEYRYFAQGVNTLPTANTTIRFTSVGGGYFDVELAANQGTVVTSQDNANTFAARLDAALQGLTFYQKRVISSYVGAGDILTNGSVTGSLTGTSFELQLEDFADVSISDIRVSPPLTGNTNGIIEFEINGELFRSAGTITDRIGAYGIYRFDSLTNANHFLEMRTGANVTYFRNTDEATNLANALKDAFGFGSGGESLQFQVGTTTQDTLKVNIRNAQTVKLYDGEDINVLTQDSASHASDVLDEAIRLITSIRADVGALQSRFDYAANNVESALQNQDAARGTLLDTDIARESTAYATAQVQLQAGIAVLAQANLLPQNLLKLIG